MPLEMVNGKNHFNFCEEKKEDVSSGKKCSEISKESRDEAIRHLSPVLHNT